MDEAKTLQYYKLFENMSRLITTPEIFQREAFIKVLVDICKLFNIAKGTTSIYKSEALENRGEGEFICDYDNGHGDKLILEKRIVTNYGFIIIGKLYASNDAKPLTSEELDKLSIIELSLLAFIGRNRMQEALERIGYYDENNYPNLRYYLRTLDKLNFEGKLSGMSAMHFNIRQLSIYNRELGRNQADIAMRNYFEAFVDIIGSEGAICRLGGDNFIGIFRKDRFEKIVSTIEGTPVSFSADPTKQIVMSSCAGIYHIPEDFVYEGPDQIISKVMFASQSAKQQGTSDYMVYDKEVTGIREKMLTIQTLFPQALKNKEFKVYYQPKVNILTGEIVGAEALCRWFHNGKMISPADFIPVLEQKTDICKLDLYMLDLVCKDIRRWLDSGMPHIRVSVNLSRKNLMDINLLDKVIEIIDRNNVPHKYIEIELTETTTDVEFRDLKRVAHGLQQQGICTSVDDFGVGYSSLNLIREIPWNVLKIDRCFLPSDEDNEYSNTPIMYKHVIEMAQEIGLECITEGVETAKQIEILRANKCHIAQGFYFDRPLPVEEFDKRLKQRFYDI